MPDFVRCLDRYAHDPVFHDLVDRVYGVLKTHAASRSDVEEALVLALPMWVEYQAVHHHAVSA